MYDLIVIGAGPGGYEAAAHAGKMGKRVALIEKDRLGGTCLNAGCIPTKAFLKSSRLFAEIRQASCYGILAAAPVLDMPAVVERKNRIVATLTGGVEGLLKHSSVEVIRGSARLESRDAVSVDGSTLEAKNILIATGSRPAVPPVPGIDSPAVADSTGLLQLTALPDRVVIIGGGYIGLEFAGFFSAAGVRTALVEMLPGIATGMDRDVAKRLGDSLRKAGVAIKTSCRVAAIAGGEVCLESGETLPADLIVNATGRVPVVEGLGLEQTGVDFDGRGIRTSAEGRTSVPGIWACGDVTGRRLLAHAATREGLVAVNNMFGRRDRMRYEAVPAVIYTHPEVASAGWTEEQLQARGIAYRKAAVPMAVSGRYLIENEGTPGMVKVLAGERYGEILGVHAIGDSSSEFIAMAAAMIETEMRVQDVAGIVFPHPTVSEALKAAIVQLIQ